MEEETPENRYILASLEQFIVCSDWTKNRLIGVCLIEQHLCIALIPSSPEWLLISTVKFDVRI